MHAQLLKMLEGCSSQKPMPFDQLAKKSGLLDSTLDMVLDQMYAAHSINQAKVTRNGIQQREVWPTGVINPTTYAINVARVAPTPPLRRAKAAQKLTEETQTMTQEFELPKLRPVTADKTAIGTLETNIILSAAEQKPKALSILEFIEANPDCHAADISKATKIDFPRAYIKTAIRDGMVVLDTSEPLKATYRLAPGMTAKSIYGSGRRKPAATVIATRPQDKAMLATEAGQELVEKAVAALEEYELPAFLRKPEEIAGAIELQVKRKVRFAFTSDSTLMLFGLDDAPIELDTDDTNKLIDFCINVAVPNIGDSRETRGAD